MLQGGLFTRDWLKEGIIETAPWRDLDQEAVDRLRGSIGDLLADLLKRRNPVEAETEN